VLKEAVNLTQRLRPSEAWRVYHGIAMVERSLHRPDETGRYLEKALSVIKEHPVRRVDREYLKTIYMDSAAFFAETDDYRAAAKIYRELLDLIGERDPNYWASRLSLAACEAHIQRFDDSRKNLEAVLNFAPEPSLRALAQKDLVLLEAMR